jgi:hypothetical protein
MSVEGYVEWQEAKQNLSRGDYMAFITVADTRLDSFPDPDLTGSCLERLAYIRRQNPSATIPTTCPCVLVSVACTLVV